MSSKLTNEMLKELIREILQEKATSNYPFDADTEFFNPFGKTKNYKKYTNARTDLGGTDNAAKAKIKALAKLDGDTDELEVDDFDDVKATDTDELEATKAIAKYGRSKSVKKPAVDALSNLGATSSTYDGKTTTKWPHSTHDDPNDLKTKTGKLSITKIRGEMKAALKAGEVKVADDYAKFIIKNMKVSNATQKVLDQVKAALGSKSSPGKSGATADALEKVLDAAAKKMDLEKIFDPQKDEVETAIPQTNVPYHQISDDDWKSGKDIDTSGIDNTTAQVFMAEISEHGNFVDMVNHYDNLMNTIEGASDKKTADVNKLKAMKAENLFNSLTVLSTLEHIINTMQGSAAGTPLEVLLALMSGGVVFGGTGGAADVLTGKQGEVLLSSKNTQLGKGKTKVSGAQAKTNFHALDVGETIWYVGWGKKPYKTLTAKEGKGLNIALSIHIVGIKRTKTSNSKGSFDYVDVDGNSLGSGLKVSGTDYVIPFRAKADATIPLGRQTTKNNRKNFNTIVNLAIEEANEKVQVAINGIYAKLENVKRQTQTFLALNKRGESGMAQATAAGKYYKDLKSDLKTGYGGVETAAGAKFQENKTKSLKDLDKLIERVILENMNKK